MNKSIQAIGRKIIVTNRGKFVLAFHWPNTCSTRHHTLASRRLLGENQALVVILTPAFPRIREGELWDRLSNGGKCGRVRLEQVSNASCETLSNLVEQNVE